MTPAKPENIDEYIAGFPSETQAVLQQIRQTIKSVIPAEADETISYGIPTFKLNGKYVVYFAGFKKHVSIYPVLEHGDLKEEIAPYKSGRGTVQFPLNKPVPYDLIAKIVHHLLLSNLDRTKKQP